MRSDPALPAEPDQRLRHVSKHDRSTRTSPRQRQFIPQVFGVIVLAAANPATAGDQVQRFDDPVGIYYGDPSVRAPMKTGVAVTDWNRDGELDLLANGWWWRPAADAPEDAPVFERGGKSGAVYPVADLDGDEQWDTVVLRNGQFIWLEDEATEGTPKFVERGPLPFALGGPLKVSDSKGATDVLQNWTIEALADLDNDGRTDLLMRRFQVERYEGDEGYAPWALAGFDTGWIDNRWIFNSFDTSYWWRRNVGAPDAPAFTLASMIEVGSSGLGLTFPWRTTSLTPIDWNEDGRTDLFVHVFDHSLVFLNVGTQPNGNPRFDSGRRLQYGDREDMGQRKAALAYRDENGRLGVLFHGGSVAYRALQESPDDRYRFAPMQWVLFDNPTTAALDIFPVPDAADWDGDGKIDLIVGSEVGFIWWFRNLDPNGGVERWDAPRLLEADGKPIRLDRHYNMQGPEEFLLGYSNPTVEDWDLDGDLDLVVGCHGETYYLFENIGTRTEPCLAARQPLTSGDPAAPVRCAWRTRPGVGDLTGDGLPDLVGVDENRHLCFWRRKRGEDGALQLGRRETPVTTDGFPFVICRPSRGLGRSKFVVVDWDQDGRQDIISSSALGDRDRFIYFYRNLGDRDGRLVLEFHPRKIMVTGHISKGHFTHYNMLEPVDFDGDGQWEGLAGMDLRHPSIRNTWLFYWPKMETIDASSTINAAPTTAIGWPAGSEKSAVMTAAVRQGDVAELREGAPVFRNRPWRFEDIPSELEGKHYICGDIEMGFVICEEPGIAYVLAPSQDGTRLDAFREEFQSRGFELCTDEAQQLFGKDARDRVWILRKEVNRGDKIVFGKWAVVVF